MSKQCSIYKGIQFLPRNEQLSAIIVRTDPEMVAWAIVSMWVVGVAVCAIPLTASLADAERWFFGADAPDRLVGFAQQGAVTKAEMALRSEADATGYLQLLPYILDPHGPGSRVSVRRDPATSATQSRKRAEGVFYTPADVAEYMAKACLSSLNAETCPTVFDPACGTGVFLRAAFHEMKNLYPGRNTFQLATESLFGADIDPWPLDATAFVLLADSWGDLGGQVCAPAEAWRRLRQNLSCIDTLLIDRAEDCNNEAGKNTSGGAKYHAISSLFPALKRGPAVILGNPPYADLGSRSDLVELGRRFQTLSVKMSASAEIYLPFIEQMTRLASSDRCSGALVLPLSVACNVGPQFSKVRELISKTPGSWRFAFFDREPHALFGEDVKTRNAIILWSREPWDRTASLATGPLRKWRGGSRSAMFQSLHFTTVEGDIRAGIPKIEGHIQAAAYKALSAHWGRLGQVVRGIERSSFAAAPDADDRTVFVGPTAYNFINAFVSPERSLFDKAEILSENPLQAIKCSSHKDALAVFAILSSHLAYWWWHTHGDGFHVSRRFISELPFGLEAFVPVRDTLAERGAELWQLIERKPIKSLNKGRTSIAFTPNGYDGIRRGIDSLLAGQVGLDERFVDEIQQFTARTVSATLRKNIVHEAEEKEWA
jgi:hypothetical protein